jgi:hypothetical protein
MAEWLKAHAWKACIRESVSRVRIPVSPPFSLHKPIVNGESAFSARFWWVFAMCVVAEERFCDGKFPKNERFSPKLKQGVRFALQRGPRVRMRFPALRECRLMSRNGNQFYSFESLAQDIGKALKATDAILDGEICCVDRHSRPHFNELLFRRGEPVFFAFDLIYCNGIDWREQPLVKRKERLRDVLRGIKCDRISYVDHVSRTGKALFQKACEMDLEGIVAKHKLGKYMSGREQSTWFKIRNRSYSQWDGRDELFEYRGEQQRPGWDTFLRAAFAAAGQKFS